MVAHTRRISPWSGLNVGPAMPCARPVRPAWSEPSPGARSSTSSLSGLELAAGVEDQVVTELVHNLGTIEQALDLFRRDAVGHVVVLQDLGQRPAAMVLADDVLRDPLLCL